MLTIREQIAEMFEHPKPLEDFVIPRRFKWSVVRRDDGTVVVTRVA